MKKILFISICLVNILYAKANNYLYEDKSNIFDYAYDGKDFYEKTISKEEYEERYKKRLEPVIDKQGRIREVKIPDYHMFKHNVYESPYKAKDFAGKWVVVKKGIYLCGPRDSKRLQNNINQVMKVSDYYLPDRSFVFSLVFSKDEGSSYYSDISYMQKIYSTEYEGLFGQTYVEDYNRYDYIEMYIPELNEEIKEYYKNPDKDLFNLNNIKYLFEYNAYGEDRMLPKELADKLSNKDRKILIDYYVAMQVRLFGLPGRMGERIIVNKDKIIEFFSHRYAVYVRREEAMKYDKFTIEVPYNIDDLDKPCGLGQKTSKRHDKRFDKIAEKLIKEGKVHVVRAYLKDSLLENE